MKNSIKTQNRTMNSSWFLRMGLAVAMAFGFSACDSILEVTDPDIVTPDALSSEAGLQTLKAGSLADFAVAMSGSSAGHGATAGLIVMSGLMSDEYDYSGTFPTRREGDTRLVQNTNGTMDGIFGNLHRARAAAEATIDAAANFDGGSDIQSEMQSLAGYIYVIFAETHCAGVPFSKAPADGSALQFGDPLTTTQMFQTAEDWFDQAIANAGGNNDLANLARVGKGRALLGLGQISEAATAVALVPTSFEYNIEHSEGSRRQENGIYTMTTTRRQFSVAEGKGINGLLYRTAGTNGDPRIQWDGGEGTGQDDQTIYYNQLKYTSPSASVVLASGIEARLIEAEGAVQSTSNATVQTIHNDLRSDIGLGALDLSGMTQAQLRDAHFEERAYWLYSTGHRHGDLRRLVREYGEVVSDVFPTGNYIKAGFYESNVTFPVPQSEANNPNYVSCLDTNP